MPDAYADGTRNDPYRKFNFKVEVTRSGAHVPLGAGYEFAFSEVTGLQDATEVVSYKEGDRTYDRKLFGKTTFENLVCSRGTSKDRNLELWRQLIHERHNGNGDDDLRADLKVTLLDRNKRPVRSWSNLDCWPVSLEIEGLSGDASDVLITRVEFAVEERSLEAIAV